MEVFALFSGLALSTCTVVVLGLATYKIAKLFYSFPKVFEVNHDLPAHLTLGPTVTFKCET